jgi:hypothetical protein
MGHMEDSYYQPLLFSATHPIPSHFKTHLRVQGQIALDYLLQHLAPTPKLEDNPSDATEKNEPMLASRQRTTERIHQ